MNTVKHYLTVVLFVQVVGNSLWAAEYAVFKSGFKLRSERHEIFGSRVRIFTHDRGVIEVPSSSIVEFEYGDYSALPMPIISSQYQVDTRSRIDMLVEHLGIELQLNPALIHSVIEVESNYDPNAVSPKGAIGLMQLMHATAREFSVTNCRDPGQNIRGGASYLRRLLYRYNGSEDSLLRALAAYNAGPGTVDYYDGLPPYRETHLFVKRVIRRFLELTESKKETNKNINKSH